MNTPTIERTADKDARTIAAAKAAATAATHARREAEKQAEAAREAEHAAAGEVAVAIAKAIEHGADPVLVLPDVMLRAHNSEPRIITSPAALTVKRLTNSLSITGSRFPGWMEITVGELFVHYMPTPLWMEWETADRARRDHAKQEARAKQALTPAQLNGCACVACGDSHRPMIPLGIETRTSSELFVCNRSECTVDPDAIRARIPVAERVTA